jgi:hypothetical protein
LLTRPPLAARVAPALPLDLHVLGTPPAFNLSQDQTLHLNQNKTKWIALQPGEGSSVRQSYLHGSNKLLAMLILRM